MLTISLVTPNFNYGHFIASALKSVLDQNYPKLQYVVIDGGSNDDSIGIVGKHRGQLHSFISEPDRGNYDAINKGFALTDGEIMGWLNSDDMLFPWCLKAVGEIFEQHPDVEWISTLQPALWDSKGSFAGLASRPGFSKDAFLDGKYLLDGRPRINISVSTRPVGTIQQESTFWRRSLWERAGGYISSEFGPAGDFELWCRFYEHADLKGVYFPLAGFRVHAAQVSSDQHGYNLQASRALALARSRAGYHRISNRCHALARKVNSGITSRSFNYYAGQTLVRAIRPDTGSAWMKSVQRFR
jgi:glycosyltransferase involved in cell wall biosynthesis